MSDTWCHLAFIYSILFYLFIYSVILFISIILFIYSIILFIYSIILFIYSIILFIYSIILFIYSIILFIYSIILFIYSIILFIYSIILFIYSIILFIYSIILFIYSIILFIYSIILFIYSIILFIYSIILFIYSIIFLFIYSIILFIYSIILFIYSNSEQNARLDVAANGVWGGRFERTFFDVRVFNPFAKSNMDTPLATTYRRHENDKRRQYEQRVIQVEHSSFVPLVFSATGGTSKSTSNFYRHLALKLSTLVCDTQSSTLSSQFRPITSRNNVYQRSSFISPQTTTQLSL